MLAAIDQGTGSAIIWVHGFPLSSAIFEPQLAIPGHRHVAPDLPGFGRSRFEARASSSIDAYADEVAALAASRGIRKATLAGVSMGGYVVFSMLRRHPELAASVILIDTRETPDGEDARKGRTAMAEAVRRDGATVAVDQMFPKMLTPETIAEGDWRADVVRRAMEPATVEGIVNALAAMADRPDSATTLRETRVPVLAVAGDRDPITPPSDAARMASLAPAGELAVIGGASHLSNVEQPAEFNRVVQAFLARIR